MCSFECGSNRKESQALDNMVYGLAKAIKLHLASNEQHRPKLSELIADIQKLLPPGFREI